MMKEKATEKSSRKAAGIFAWGKHSVFKEMFVLE